MTDAILAAHSEADLPTQEEVADLRTRVLAESSRRANGVDAGQINLPDLTPEDLDRLEARSQTPIGRDEAGFDASNLPFAGAGVEVSRILEQQQAAMAVRSGTATYAQQLAYAEAAVDARRDKTFMAGLQDTGADVFTMGVEFAGASLAGSGAAAAGSRLLARQGLKLGEKATSTMLLRRATDLGLLTAGREGAPRALGHEGGAWTANSLRRALPDLDISDEDAENLAAMTEAQFADVFLGKAFEQNSIYRGLAEDVMSSALEKAVGPAFARMTAGSALRGLQGRVMQKLGAGQSASGLARKMQDATAISGGLNEVVEEVVQGMAVEQAFGENMLEGLPESWEQLAQIALIGSVPGAVGNAISTVRNKRRAEAKAAAEAPPGNEKPGEAVTSEGGDASTPGEATAATAGVEPGVSAEETAAAPTEKLLAAFRPQEAPVTEGAQSSAQGLPSTAPVALESGEAQTQIGRSLYGTLQAVPEVEGEARVELPQVMKSLSGIVEAAGSKQAIREGKAANVPTGAAGAFWTRKRTIDIRQANDIATGAHEVAHSLEQAIYGLDDPWAEGGAAGLDQAQRGELFALGKRLYGDTEPNGGYLREGWAELVRGYIVNDGEPTAPGMTRWLTDTFLAQRPEVARAVEKARTQARVWRLQGSPERVGASIKKREGRVTKAAKAVGTKEGRKQVKEDGYDNFVDMFGVYKRGVQEIEAETGKLLAPSQNTYKLASALRQTGPARLDYMIDKGGIDLAGNPTGGPSLRDVKALVKGRGDEFAQYLYARRAKALWEQPIVEKLGPSENVGLVIEQAKARLRNQAGQVPETDAVLKELGSRDPGISYADTMETLRVLESPEFSRAAEMVHQWYDGIMDYVSGASPTLAKAVAAIREKDPGSYMPLRRVFDQLTGRGRGGPGSAASGNVAKRLKGSGRQIVDPFPQLIAQAQRHIDMAHERAVLDSVLQWEKLSPGMGHLVTEVPVEKVPGAVRDIDSLISEIEKRVDGESAGAEALREELGDSVDEVVTFFMQSRQPSKGDGKAPIIPVVENGKLKYYQVDSKLHDALVGLHVPQVDGLMRWMAATSKRAFTAGTTGMNPAFTLITNPLRDVATYAANTETANPVQAITGYVTGLGEALLGTVTAGKKPTAFWEVFERLGVKMSQRYAEDNARTENVAKRLAGGGSRVVNWTGDVWNYVVEAMNFPEAAPRIAEMKAKAKKVGWTPGIEMTMDQAIEIALAGKQVTVDFSAAGETARNINKYVPFFNVAFQSARSYARAVKDSPAKAVATGFALFTAPTIAMWLVNKDEEWYQEMEDEERYTYFFAGLKDGGLMRFPRSFEPHFIFATIPEILLNNLNKVNPEAAETLGRQLVDSMYQIGSEARRTFTPNFLPVPAQVAAEQLANEVFFFDSPIVPQSVEERAPEEQYTEYTSKGAIWLGEKLGVSPARVSHAINGFTGTVGREVQNLTGSAMDEVGREKSAADWPVFGRLFKRGGQDEVRSRSVSRIYDEKKKARQIYSSLKETETDEQRDRRLFIEDAAKLMTGLSAIRRLEPSNELRAAIARKRRDYAQEVNQRLDNGTWREVADEFNDLGRDAAKEKRRLTTDLKGKMREAAQN